MRKCKPKSQNLKHQIFFATPFNLWTAPNVSYLNIPKSGASFFSTSFKISILLNSYLNQFNCIYFLKENVTFQNSVSWIFVKYNWQKWHSSHWQRLHIVPSLYWPLVQARDCRPQLFQSPCKAHQKVWSVAPWSVRVSKFYFLQCKLCGKTPNPRER